MRDERLRIYLNDHLAGSAAARALAERARRENAGSPLAAWLERLLQQLEFERAVVRQLLSAVGGRENEIKQAAGWVLEKVSRLKLNGQLRGYSDLSRVVELEALESGIHGKLLLWRLLGQLAREDPRLRVADFDELVRRAERQLEDLERERFHAADQAFVQL